LDLDRLHELISIAVAAHRQRDLLVAMMKWPHRFYVEPRGDEFELRLVSLESGKHVTLGSLAVADIVRKPQG
jgi:hypothetical protein